MMKWLPMILIMTTAAFGQTTRPAAQQSYFQLLSEVTKLRAENERLKAENATLKGQGSEPTTKPVAIATTRPIRKFANPGELMGKIPQAMKKDVRGMTQLQAEEQLAPVYKFLHSFTGDRIRVVLPIDNIALIQNCLDSDETRYKWYVEITGNDYRQIHCAVQAWFDIGNQKQMTPLIKGDVVSIEGTICAMSCLANGNPQGSIHVRLKDCEYTKVSSAPARGR